VTLIGRAGSIPAPGTKCQLASPLIGFFNFSANLWVKSMLI